ncbi:hypothetical protein KDA_09560 [Dictyobacter alpinus]|uniref:HEAT repeat domain-containing protein n=1 Tax=Dictyobacter alpinus TaxID=2014873 RepID=A0A402B294_9CHLR|nr:HEAT repeat domain-containing protein [Dictyobacter alpinus]GCE25472.1 hypothetical protein KDA_09560 [Dictyobacter alpinus]
MEKWDARPLQSTHNTQYGWNVLELESRQNLHSKIRELIDLTLHSPLSTRDMQHCLHLCQAEFGKLFAFQLVRSLQRTDVDEREAVVWLITQLQDQYTVPLLQKLSQQQHQSRAVRLSASLALAGMGETKEMQTTPPPRLYAIS